MSVHVEIDTGHQWPMPRFLRAMLGWLGHRTQTGARADTPH